MFLIVERNQCFLLSFLSLRKGFVSHKQLGAEYSSRRLIVDTHVVTSYSLISNEGIDVRYGEVW